MTKISIKELAERWEYKISYIYKLRCSNPEKLPKTKGRGNKYELEDVIEFEKKVKKVK